MQGVFEVLHVLSLCLLPVPFYYVTYYENSLCSDEWKEYLYLFIIVYTCIRCYMYTLGKSVQVYFGSAVSELLFENSNNLQTCINKRK